MPINNHSPIFAKLLNWSQAFTKAHQSAAVDGADYGLAGQTAYTKAEHKLLSGGRVEVNLTTPAALPDFSWLAEITIDDTANDDFRHILLQSDNTIVETMGKTVTPIPDDQADTIFKQLNKLID